MLGTAVKKLSEQHRDWKGKNGIKVLNQLIAPEYESLVNMTRGTLILSLTLSLNVVGRGLIFLVAWYPLQAIKLVNISLILN